MLSHYIQGKPDVIWTKVWPDPNYLNNLAYLSGTTAFNKSFDCWEILLGANIFFE